MPKPWNNWASTILLLQVLLLHRLVSPCAWAVCYDLHLTGLIADYCCHYKFKNIHTHTYHVDMAPQCAVSFSILNDPYSMATFLLEFSMTFFMQTHLRFLDSFFVHNSQFDANSLLHAMVQMAQRARLTAVCLLLSSRTGWYQTLQGGINWILGCSLDVWKQKIRWAWKEGFEN